MKQITNEQIKQQIMNAADYFADGNLASLLNGKTIEETIAAIKVRYDQIVAQFGRQVSLTNVVNNYFC